MLILTQIQIKEQQQVLKIRNNFFINKMDSNQENKCMFTSSILNKLENIKIQNNDITTNEIQIINQKIDY